MSKDAQLSEAIRTVDAEWGTYKTDFMEFSQGPSDFQMEVFIANGEGPVDLFPCHAYRHILAQVKPILGELRRLMIERERQIRKVKRLEQKISGLVPSPGELDLDLDLLQESGMLDDMEITIKGKWEQYNTFNRLLKFLREKHGEFTNGQLQAEEWKYWTVRFAKQVVDSIEGGKTGAGSGNLNSIRMAVQGSPLPDSPHHMPYLPDNFEDLKLVAEGNPIVLDQIFASHHLLGSNQTTQIRHDAE